jgi:hypothetical protein
MVSFVYGDSQEPIMVGDFVMIDCHPGIITGVYLKGSEEAKGCDCEDTGALAVVINGQCPLLLPFGCVAIISKVRSP